MCSTVLAMPNKPEKKITFRIYSVFAGLTGFTLNFKWVHTWPDISPRSSWEVWFPFSSNNPHSCLLALGFVTSFFIEKTEAIISHSLIFPTAPPASHPSLCLPFRAMQGRQIGTATMEIGMEVPQKIKARTVV